MKDTGGSRAPTRMQRRDAKGDHARRGLTGIKPPPLAHAQGSTFQLARLAVLLLSAWQKLDRTSLPNLR